MRLREMYSSVRHLGGGAVVSCAASVVRGEEQRGQRTAAWCIRARGRKWCACCLLCTLGLRSRFPRNNANKTTTKKKKLTMYHSSANQGSVTTRRRSRWSLFCCVASRICEARMRARFERSLLGEMGRQHRWCETSLGTRADPLSKQGLAWPSMYLHDDVAEGYSCGARCGGAAACTGG
jgi:hypothetical protein